MPDPGRDWRTVLLAVGSIASALLAMVLVASIGIYTTLPAAESSLARATSPLDALIAATAFLFMGAMAIPAGYHSISYLIGQKRQVVQPTMLSVWQCLVLLALWLGAAFAAGLLVDKSPWKWLTPLPYLMAIGIPVYFLVRLVAGGLPMGSARRFWGLLWTGMTAGPMLAISAEIGVVIILVFVAAIYLAINPAQLAGLEILMRRLTEAGNSQQALVVALPLLEHPAALALALVFFSGIAPVIEETAKSLAVWSVFDHLESGAQGLVAGALSGAGFGLVESLLASASPDQNWAPTLLIRGGSSMMHIAAAGLTGWGIASFRSTRQARRLLGGYGSAILLHGLWNASVVSITYGAIRLTTGAGVFTLGATLLTAIGGVVIGVLCVSIPTGLGLMNARFRRVLPAARPAAEAAGGMDGPGRSDPSA